MADNPTSPAAGSHESGGEQSPRSGVREQDRYLPIANISRIMKKALPANGKIAKDAKDTVQECVSEFISFVTSEASDKCQKEKRKTINGDDLLWAMATLGFEEYIEPLKVLLKSNHLTLLFSLVLLDDVMLQLEGDAKGSARGGDGSSKREAVGGLPAQNAQYALQGSMSYISPQKVPVFIEGGATCPKSQYYYTRIDSIIYVNEKIKLDRRMVLHETRFILSNLSRTFSGVILNSAKQLIFSGTGTAYDPSFHARQRVGFGFAFVNSMHSSAGWFLGAFESIPHEPVDVSL
ncbi:CCAAT-BINDING TRANSCRIPTION FACTOR-RELATED [Salix koriyanagi]|uniref:CCAAT-BINDING TRANSCRIPTION FACTOR-RELATED n=1 Tax=Salix koriyanagi TaxID=2511006 RepID=A0A9Q0WT06_9ROSI|nr:CCAAT-BINDING TRANSCRIPTION FACTOR-RELATED [Salix koriyanagi]